MEVPRLSKSRILQYCRCPMQYKLVNINQVPFTSPAMERGKWFHSIAEKFFDRLDYENLNPKQFEPALRKLAGNEKYEYYQIWFDNFIKFETERFNRLPKQHFKPKHREVKIVLYGMSGVIDRVDFDPSTGKYLLIDYKTGKSTNVKKQIFEMTVYAFLFREQFKKNIPNVGVWSAADGKLTQAEITEEHIIEMRRIVEETRNSIGEEYFPIAPKNCWWCPGNVKDLCKTVNKEDWIKHNKKLVE